MNPENAQGFATLPQLSQMSTDSGVPGSVQPFVAWNTISRPVSKGDFLSGVEGRVRGRTFLKEAQASGASAWAHLESLERQLHAMLTELDGREAEISKRQKQADELQQALATREQAIQEKEKQLERIESLACSINEAAGGIEALKKGYWTENLPEIVNFSLDLIEKIIGDRLINDPKIIVNHLKTVLEGIKASDAVYIYLNPDDHAALTGLENADIQNLLGRTEIRFVTDMRLGSGEVLIDADKYRLDAGLKTVLHNIREDLLESLAKAPQETPVTEDPAPQNESDKLKEDPDT